MYKHIRYARRLQKIRFRYSNQFITISVNRTVATVRITTEATWSLQRHNDHHECCTIKTNTRYQQNQLHEDPSAETNLFQLLASDYVVKEVFNDELEKEKVYIWR
jgi:LAS superfamily LD-carboxypeptidase LdcB